MFDLSGFIGYGLCYLDFSNHASNNTVHEFVLKIDSIITIVFIGRVNLVTIQQSINVNMTHIESKTQQIVADDPHTQFILGQIIHRFAFPPIMYRKSLTRSHTGHI